MPKTAHFEQILYQFRRWNDGVHLSSRCDLCLGNFGFLSLVLQWTCVHDIQDGDPRENSPSDSMTTSIDSLATEQSTSGGEPRPPSSSGVSPRGKASLPRRGPSPPGTPTLRPGEPEGSGVRPGTSRSSSTESTDPDPSSSPGAPCPSQPLQAASAPFILSVSSGVPGSSDTNAEAPSSQESDTDTPTEADRRASHDSTEGNQLDCPVGNGPIRSDETNSQSEPSSPLLQYPPAQSVTLGESVTFIIRSGAQVAERTLLLLGQNPPPTDYNVRIHPNKRRLTHYIQEPNVGRGFIKEINFSNDGRLLCSPFGFGMRLLAFGPECQELCDVQPVRPMQLFELTSNMSHVSSVVASKFSPTHCLLVTGCLNGKIDFHQPVL